MSQFIGASVRAHEDFSLRFGKDLMKSGKATEIAGFCEQFYVFELSDAQAKKLNLADAGVGALHSARPETFPVLSVAQVKDVTMSRTGAIDLGKPIASKVTFVPSAPAVR